MMNRFLMANSFLIPSNSMGLEVNSNEIHNLDSNCGEFAIIKSHVGLNVFTIWRKQWIEKSQQTVGQFSSHDFMQLEKPIAKQVAAQFETKIRQQAVAQLTQIPWRYN